MRNEKMLANAICVKLRDQKYNDHSMQIQIRNTDNGILMFESVEKLLAYKLYGKVVDNNAENLLTLADYERKLPYEIREVSVIAFKLNKNYDNCIGDNVIDIRSEKLRKIDKAIDKINEKYNGNIIKIARQSSPWYEKYL